MQYSENFNFNLPEPTDNAIIEDINANFAVIDKKLGCVPVENGGTGAKTAAEAREMLGITPENIGAQPKMAGAATTVADNNLTAARALVSDSGGKIAVSDVTAAELKYLDGVTSNVQTQLNGKAASSHTHSAENITGGTLPIARGGTGNTTGQAASAVKLVTARTVKTNLGSTSGAAFNGTADISPGVDGILPVTNGGTGASSVDTAPTSGSSKMVTSGGVYAALSKKAPAYKYSTTDLTAGTSALETGTLYFVYE